MTSRRHGLTRDRGEPGEDDEEQISVGELRRLPRLGAFMTSPHAMPQDHDSGAFPQLSK